MARQRRAIPRKSTATNAELRAKIEELYELLDDEDDYDDSEEDEEYGDEDEEDDYEDEEVAPRRRVHKTRFAVRQPKRRTIDPEPGRRRARRRQPTV